MSSLSPFYYSHSIWRLDWLLSRKRLLQHEAPSCGRLLPLPLPWGGSSLPVIERHTCQWASSASSSPLTHVPSSAEGSLSLPSLSPKSASPLCTPSSLPHANVWVKTELSPRWSVSRLLAQRRYKYSPATCHGNFWSSLWLQILHIWKLYLSFQQSSGYLQLQQFLQLVLWKPIRERITSWNGWALVLSKLDL